MFLPKEGRELTLRADIAVQCNVMASSTTFVSKLPQLTFLFLELRENCFGGVRIENLRTAPYDTSSLLLERRAVEQVSGGFMILNPGQVTGQTALYTLSPHQ